MKSYNYAKLNDVILDSGPLLLALTIHYTQYYDIKNNVEIIKRVYSNLDNIPNPVYNLIRFFDSINSIHSTPHVIGEVIGLVKSRLKLKIKENDFWISSLDYFKRRKLTEKLVTIIDMSNDRIFNPLISKIGVVDSELIKYAFESKMPIVSIDKRTLKNEAEKKSVNVLIIDDDIFSYI